MKLKRILALALTFALLTVPLPAAAFGNPLDTSTAGQVNGLYLSTTHGQDFPSAPDLSAREQKQELDAIVTFAAQYGFNTIYFEAVSGGGAFYHSKQFGQSEYLSTKQTSGLFSLGQIDPLKYLVQQAQKQNIAVAAVIDPFLASEASAPPASKQNTAAKNGEFVLSGGKGKQYFNPSESFTQHLVVSAVKELAGYALSGIVLKNFAYPSDDFELRTTADEKTAVLKKLLANATHAAGKIPIGLQTGYTPAQLSDSAVFTGYAPLLEWGKQGLYSFIVPELDATVDSGAYANELSSWTSLELPVYTGNAANRVLAPFADSTYYGNRQELDLQLYTNNQLGAKGCVIRNYSSIKENFFDVATGLAAAFAPVTPVTNGFDVSIPQSFAVTRPTDGIDWIYDTFYIMGTSDPSQPVTIDGEPIPQSTHGLYGTLVRLSQGLNTFTVAQGGNSKTVSINRYTPVESPISKLRQSAIFPAYGEGVRVGEEFTLSCIAPSGAAVVAGIEGRTIQLVQTTQAADGMPVTFSATATLTDNYPSGETTRLGKVNYSMNYGGADSNYISNGELFAVGTDSKFAIEVTDMRGDTSSVNLAADFRDKMITSVEKGATDYVVGSSPSYYLLSCGGYIHKEDVKVLEGVVDIDNTVSGTPTFTTDTQGETYTMKASAKPYYISVYAEDTVTITFYNTSGMPEHFDTAKSQLFSAITTTYNAQSNSTEMVLKTKDSKRLWGYNVEFRDGELLLFGKYTPTLSQNPAKPLEGVTIIVDAGHGGNDPGALGVAGVSGPVENELNFMNAAAAALRLQALGATVHQTQTTHERLSYEQRMDIARDTHADFYLSFHLNSTGEITDSTNINGVEIYYNEELSIPFGEAILDGVCSATGRTKRGVLPATFRVTQMTHTPSLLCEMGYMVSPFEYDALCQPINIYKSSLGIATGVTEAIRRANAPAQAQSESASSEEAPSSIN